MSGAGYFIYLFKNFRRVVIDERNNSGSGGFHKFHVRRRNIRRGGGIAESTGGAVAGMAEDSDHRPVEQQRAYFGAGTQFEAILDSGIGGQEDVGVRERAFGCPNEGGGNQEGDAEEFEDGNGGRAAIGGLRKGWIPHCEMKTEEEDEDEDGGSDCWNL